MKILFNVFLFGGHKSNNPAVIIQILTLSGLSFFFYGGPCPYLPTVFYIVSCSMLWIDRLTEGYFFTSSINYRNCNAIFIC